MTWECFIKRPAFLGTQMTRQILVGKDSIK
jgi:hypothetical protein